MLKNRKISLIILTGFLAVAVSYGFVNKYDRDFAIVKNLDIFYTMFRELNLFYVDDIDPEKIIKTGIDAMLESLDPYTVFIPESEMDEFNFMTTGEYGGIGAIIRMTEDYTLIAEPYDSSPAARAGLRAGDKILSVDGVSTRKMALSDVSDKLKGKPGTEVKLVILSHGETRSRKVNFRREQIRINNISWYGKLDEKTGYIRLSNFTLGAGEETKNAFKDLKAQGIERLILDVRSNPGGLLMEAVNVSNLFVDRGRLIVSTKGKVQHWDQDYYTTEAPVDTEIPLIILINRGTASAAEIVAGAMQDLDRAVIIGQRTFGKGLVQASRKLKYNSQLKVTSAKYYIPSGRCIQALDYTHRNEDGSVGHIPDSLISEFKTENGRVVYDGGGIMPDIEDRFETYSQLTLNLYAQQHIFDFANDFFVRNRENLPNPEDFQIDDKEYQKFNEMIRERNFSYTTQSERKLEELIETAKRERYFEIAEKELELLKEKLSQDNEKDMALFRDEIAQLLNEEIMSRYYFQAGRVISSLRTDNQIKLAQEVFQNGKFNWEKGTIQEIALIP